MATIQPGESSGSSAGVAAAGLGAIAEPFPAAVCNTAIALTSGTVFGSYVGLTAGTVLTGIKARVTQAAAGTAPTTARLGLADGTGKMVALTGNVGAAASWPAGVAPFAFASSYTVPADGGYLACVIVVGTWGTTQADIAVFSGLALAHTADGTNPPPQFQWAGQTDLPAAGASLNLSTNGSNVPYLAPY